MTTDNVRLPPHPSLPLSRHRRGRDRLRSACLPVLLTVNQLIEFLHIQSTAQLGWLLRATDKNNGPYGTFTIPKRDGSARTICAPRATLRMVQRRILDNILAPVAIHKAAHGFVRGRSTVSNARAHVGANLIIKFDLENFFPTVNYRRVVGMFASLGYPAGQCKFSSTPTSTWVSGTLARLCCYTEDERKWGSGYTPQGAPTSPMITNILCRRMDTRLTGLAKSFAGVYTRYADDMTFSFRGDEPSIGKFRWWVTQICDQEGFKIKDSKFRVVRRSQRQTVTGLVVNDVVRIPREDRRRIRAILHNCQRHGLESQLRGNDGLLQWLLGMASYIHMVYRREGRRLIRQVQALRNLAD